MTETLTLALDDIEIPANRLREADPDKVAEMVVSLGERGQLQDIEVLPKNGDGKHPLNIGLHRLLAARQLKWAQISAKVFDGDPLQARLREIDENLYRHELNPLDQAVFLAERREIYERLHGKVRRGGDRRTKPANLRQWSFFDDTTASFGLSRATIERALTRFWKLSPEVIRALRGTRMARIASEIDALAKLEPAEQLKVVVLLTGEDPPKNVSAALVKLRNGRAQAPRASKTAFERLQTTWKSAPEEDRKQFLAWLRTQGFLATKRSAKR